MKKKIFYLFIILATVLTMIFSGCGSKEAKPEALAGDHSKNTSLDSLKVANATTLFLMRNNTQYHAGDIIYTDGNQCGTKITTEEGLNGNGHLCFDVLNTETQEYDVISIKDLPVPVIHENDKFYAFSWESNFGIYVKPLKFVGYSPLVITNPDSTVNVEEKDHVLNKKWEADELTISLIDENNKTIKDISLEEARKLEYGQRVEVYVANNKTEKSYIWRTSARCAYYEYDTSKKAIKLESIGEETVNNNKYSIYDPTKLEQGYYALCSGNSIKSVFVVQ